MELDDPEWLDHYDRARLRETAELFYRLCEDLDAIRDRTQVLQDQIRDRHAEQLNRRMLLLSIVAAIFLPLSLLTGLLGINVDGIPGTSDPAAFWIVCAVLTGLGAICFWVARRLGMFG